MDGGRSGICISNLLFPSETARCMGTHTHFPLQNGFILHLVNFRVLWHRRSVACETWWYHSNAINTLGDGCIHHYIDNRCCVSSIASHTKRTHLHRYRNRCRNKSNAKSVLRSHLFASRWVTFCCVVTIMLVLRLFTKSAETQTV